MFRPLTGHHQVVHLKKRAEVCAISLDAQPDDGLLEAETCSWLAVTIIRYIYIYIYIYIKYSCVLTFKRLLFNPLNPELNPICYLLALLDHHFFHVSRIRVKSLTLRLLMSYIYMEHPFLIFLDHTQRRSTVGRTPLDD